jgi:uncharacterized protein Yka (UPF0111/DUF47 family)
MVPAMPDFNGMLTAQAGNLCATMTALVAYLESGDLAEATRVNELAEQGHGLCDTTLGTLYSSFITPIDREDIHKLAMSIDHVLDYLKNTVREVEVLQVEPDAWMQRMSQELAQGADTLQEGLVCFAAGEAQTVRQTVKTREAERHVEDLYREALENMFQGDHYERLRVSNSASAVGECLDFVVSRIKQREVYRHLSNAADRLAQAGETLRDVSIKYDEGRSGSER